MIFLKVLQIWGRQRWLPFGIRDRLLRFFAPPERLSGRLFDCDTYGLHYAGDLGNFIDWTVFFYGTYEGGIQTLLGNIGDLAGPQAVFFDVGANVGLHSLFMTGHAERIHAFEPWAPALSRLRQAVSYNGLECVTIHPFALGGKEDELPFYSPSSANLGTGSFCPDVNVNQLLGKLPIRPGDAVLDELGLERLDVLKIDTEGFEFEVLRGLARSLECFKPVLVAEISVITHQGDIPTTLKAVLPADWEMLWVDDHPEHYRLRKTMPQDRSSLILVAGPADKMRRLPLTG